MKQEFKKPHKENPIWGGVKDNNIYVSSGCKKSKSFAFDNYEDLIKFINEK